MIFKKKDRLWTNELFIKFNNSLLNVKIGILKVDFVIELNDNLLTSIK